MVKYLLAALLVTLALTNIHVASHRESPVKPIVKRHQIDSFHLALDAFHHDTGRYPTSIEGLQALRDGAGIRGWRGPYLPRDVPTDPWNHPYKYRLHSAGFPIIN